MDDFLKMFLGMNRRIKKEPVALLKDHTEITFLTKRLDDLSMKLSNKHKELLVQKNEKLLNEGKREKYQQNCLKIATITEVINTLDKYKI